MIITILLLLILMAIPGGAQLLFGLMYILFWGVVILFVLGAVSLFIISAIN